MNLKNWLTVAALTILPKPTPAEASKAPTDSLTSTEAATELTLSSSPDILPDSLILDTVLPDSALYETRMNLLRESRHDMLLLIAHFEAIKPRAYWDNIAKIYSVGYGFIEKPDGSRVTRGTIIKSEEELNEYWIDFTEKKMFPTMAACLKIENTDHQERVSLASTAFNCGAGIYGNSNKKTISKYAETLNKFLTSRDSIYLNKSLHMLQSHCKSRGKVVDALKKRRRLEADIFSHKIILVNSDTLQYSDSLAYTQNDTLPLDENYLDLNKTIIGASYSIGKLPQDSTELAVRIRNYDKNGFNYTDSLTKAFTMPIFPTNNRRRTASKRSKSKGR